MLFKKELSEYNRYQAFAFHMIISLVIFFILLVSITQYWYPGILFEAGNAWRAIILIVGIDLILGPALTLIIFNTKKKSLKFDLFIIALVQISALFYGTWTIYQSHPVALVYVGSSFHIIPNSAPFSDEISELASTSNYQLYYQTNSKNVSAKLNPKQFYPYFQYRKEVIKEQEAKGAENPYLIRLKRSGKPYGIQIDSVSLEILSVTPMIVTK